MQTTAEPAATEQFQLAWEEKYRASMANFIGNVEVIAKLANSIPGLEIEIRRFFWPEQTPAEAISMDICYLSLAITPRPQAMMINYLGAQPQAFTSFGNCCFVPAGQSTRSQAGMGEYQEICCLFDPALLEPHIDWHWTPLELAACFNIKNMNIQSLLLRLAEEANRPGYGSEQLVKGLFGSLLIELSRHFKAVRSSHQTSSGKLSVHQLNLINDKIRASLDQDLPIDTLAELCSLSSRHLSRMFKKTTGYTLGKHISHERINLAKVLLAQPQGLVKEVAYKCGFHSQSSFSQAFHDATGLTPSQFRSQSYTGC